MGRSIRSSRGKELRRLQREKLATWDKQRIQKLSNALAKTQDHVTYSENGEESKFTCLFCNVNINYNKQSIFQIPNNKN